MRHNRFVKCFCTVLLTAVLLAMFSVSVSANAPAWPDIIIKLDQPYDGDYVVIVLSDRNEYYQLEWFEDDWSYEENEYTKAEQAAVSKLQSVGDEDGYTYIAWSDPLNKTNGDTDLTYFHDTFKIALYFPDTDTLVKTDILKKESYIEVFKLTLDAQKIAEIQVAEYSKQKLSEGEYHPAVTTEKPFLSSGMVNKFFICLAVNLVAEGLIALFFGYRKWRHLLTIAVTNTITLILLTLSVILINPPLPYGEMLSFPFALFEIAVAAAEGAVYALLFRRFEYRAKYRPWLAVIYAVVANLVTYLIGAYFYLIPH